MNKCSRWAVRSIYHAKAVEKAVDRKEGCHIARWHERTYIKLSSFKKHYKYISSFYHTTKPKWKKSILVSSYGIDQRFPNKSPGKSKFSQVFIISYKIFKFHIKSWNTLGNKWLLDQFILKVYPKLWQLWAWVTTSIDLISIIEKIMSWLFV